jgi:1-acyl-sn-glycerol-3-phosphate acyltransferase
MATMKGKKGNAPPQGAQWEELLHRTDDLIKSTTGTNGRGSGNGSESYDNDMRRKLFSRAELLRIEAEELLEGDDNGGGSEASNNSSHAQSQFDEISKQLDGFVSALPLLPVKRKSTVWSKVDYCFRFTGFIATFVFIGVFASVPVVALKYVDKLLAFDARRSLSIKVRRLISWFLLYVSGVHQTVIGSEVVDSKIDSCAILTFAHASNLDGFMVSSTCPIPHYALAKKELFVVPFFSWFSLAVGGIPVDRNNRERAISALQRSTEAVKDGKMCIVVAPEGTRSTSGHLNAFKKGKNSCL